MLHCEVAIASPERTSALQATGTAGAAVWEFAAAPRAAACTYQLRMTMISTGL